MLSRSGLLFVIATIPLLFAAVQPVVWAIYAGLIFFLFIYSVWFDEVDFRGIASPLLVLGAGIFFAYTLFQVVPLPAGLLQYLNPFRHQVAQHAGALLGDGTPWHSISYVPSVALARWIFLLSLLLFAGLLRAHLNKSSHLVTLVAVMLGVALLQSLYGLVQALIPTLGVLWADTQAGLGNARGTFINRNHFAGFVEMVWPLGLGLILTLAHAWRRERNAHTGGLRRLKVYLSSDHVGVQLFLWAALWFILLAMLFSKSRAGITGAFIGLLAYLLLCRLGGKKMNVPALLTMGLGLAFLLIYGNAIGFEQIVERFSRLDVDGLPRMDRWKDTIAIIKSHPFGIGLGNYSNVMPVFNALGPYGIKHTHAHNDYLQLLAEAGWPGFIALVGGFYLFLAKSILRIRRLGRTMDPARFYISVGAVSGLISIAFHSFFDFNLQIPANMLYFVVLMAIVAYQN